ncbi:hypothetical protein [Tsukamurella sp. PLM1]|uniref:hypothetical protein n=1 Tax=Tsukamurella sp. PLM1 TaxID=2929795 RepID=UPI002053A351|nr:hypothetical protein MTP03_18660 [Tsukamurella sp. PLM1]
MTARAPITPFEAEGVLFDLDGVLTDTAAVHRRAWAELFVPYLAGAAPGAPRTPTPTTTPSSTAPPGSTGSGLCWPRVVSRSPTGATGTTSTRPPCAASGIERTPRSCACSTATVCTPSPGPWRWSGAGAARVPMAVVSSSKNARVVLERAGLLEYFSVVVDGLVAAGRGIPASRRRTCS